MLIATPWRVYRSESDDFGAGVVEADVSAQESPDEQAELPDEAGGDDAADDGDGDEDVSSLAEDAIELSEWFKSRGMELPEGADPEDYLESLAEKSRQVDELTVKNRSMEEQFRQWQPPVPQQVPTPMVPPAPVKQVRPDLLNHWSSQPEYDERWLSQIVEDPKGGYTVKPGSDPSIIQKAIQYKEWQSEALQRMVQNPRQLVGELVLTDPIIERAIQQRIDQAVQAAVSPIHREREAMSMLREVQPDLDSDPQFRQDYLSALDMAFQNGVTTDQAQHKLATDVARRLRAERAAATKQATPSEAKARKIVLGAKQGAKRTPPASGSLQKSERPRSPVPSSNRDLTEMMLQRLRKQEAE